MYKVYTEFKFTMLRLNYFDVYRHAAGYVTRHVKMWKWKQWNDTPVSSKTLS